MQYMQDLPLESWDKLMLPVQLTPKINQLRCCQTGTFRPPTHACLSERVYPSPGIAHGRESVCNSFNKSSQLDQVLMWAIGETIY